MKTKWASDWCRQTTSKQTSWWPLKFCFARTLSAYWDQFSFLLQWCKSGVKPCSSCDGYQAQIKLFRSFLCGLGVSGQVQFWIQVNSLSVKMLGSPQGICITLPCWDRGGFEIQLCCLNKICWHFSGDSHCSQPEKIWSNQRKTLSCRGVNMCLPDLSSKTCPHFLLSLLNSANQLTLMLRQNKR